LLPILVGMIVRHFAPDLAQRMARWLRPTAFVIVVVVIAFSVAVGARMVLDNLVRATPAIFALNLAAMGFGLLLGRVLRADARDAMTLAIETGVQNVTLAIFLTLTVLGNLPLAVTQNIYGVVMILNATLLIRWWRRRIDAEAP
jgi:BASS family bile acid:Na+ symporter